MLLTEDERRTLEGDLADHVREACGRFGQLTYFSIEKIHDTSGKVLRVGIGQDENGRMLMEDYDPADFGYSIMGYRLFGKCRRDIARMLAASGLEEI